MLHAMPSRTDNHVCHSWLGPYAGARFREGRHAGESSAARLRLRVDLDVDGVAAALAAEDRHTQRLGDEVHAEPVLADLPNLRSRDIMRIELSASSSNYY